MTFIKRFGLISLSLALCISLLLAGLLILSRQSVKAADTSGFNPANIISDGVFTNKNAMSVGQIQSFLESKGSTCLANFTALSLNDTNSDGLGDEPYGKGVNEYVSAATLIWQAAQIYRINPQVILVTLEKEQGLVTRRDCPSWRYNAALGYGCPDSQPCSVTGYGFTRQIDYGVWHFRGFFDDTYPRPPTIPGSKFIAYNSDVNRCGGKTITIQNRATAALYSYTPYQPNAAALAAAPGQVVDCGAYGNLNFWRYFTRWFDPFTAIANNLTMNIVSQPDTTPARGQEVTYTVSYINNLPYAVTVDAVGIVGRLGDLSTGAGRDFGWVGPITFQPGVAQQFTFTTTVKDVGTTYAWPAVGYQGRYIHYNNWGVAMNAHQANLSLTTPLSMSPSNPTTGQTVTLSASVKNNEEHPIRMDALGIPIRYYDRYNYDVAWTSVANTLAAGATQELSGTTTFDKSGPYDAWVSWNMNGQYTTLSPTLSRNVAPASPNFTLTYIEAPNPAPALGEDIVVKFKLKNNLSIPMSLNAVGVVGRYGNPYTGANKDLGWVGPETFAAGEEKSYTTFVSTISTLDTLYTWVAINHNSTYTHYNNWGFMIAPHIPNLSLIAPLTINSGSPVQVGQTVPVTASIKNNEPRPIRYNALGIPARYYGTYNYDAAWVGPGILAASAHLPF